MVGSVTNILVELHVPDFAKVKEFYSKLGFKVVWEKPPHEKEGYLVMRKDKSIISFYCGNEHVYEHSYFSKYPKDSKKGYAVELAIPVDDIDKFYKDVERLMPESIIKPEKLESWNKKDFRIEDPFGFYLRFTEPINLLYEK